MRVDSIWMPSRSLQKLCNELKSLKLKSLKLLRLRSLRSLNLKDLKTKIKMKLQTQTRTQAQVRARQMKLTSEKRLLKRSRTQSSHLDTTHKLSPNGSRTRAPLGRNLSVNNKCTTRSKPRQTWPRLLRKWRTCLIASWKN